MGRIIGGVLLGYLTMAIIVFALFTAAYLAMGADGAFQPGTYDVSSQWLVVWFVVSVLAAVAGGWVCAKIGRRATAPMALAVVVLVLGAASAVYEIQFKPVPQTNVRTGAVGNFDAMQNARQPTWTALTTPIIGVLGILIGARLRRGPEIGSPEL